MKLAARLFLIGYCLTALAFAQSSPEKELLQKIRRNKIDVKAVYRVRDMSFTREDVRLYFSEGMIALLEPIEAPGFAPRVTGALFVGEGETLILPPDIGEKRSLAHFIGTPVLNEKLTAGFLRFGDNSAADLLEAMKDHTIKGGPSPAEFVEEWSPVVQNLDLMYDLRLLNDFLMPAGAAHPFFSAHLFGQKLGAFDISVDPLANEQITVGQINWKDGRRFTDLWLSFQSASARARLKNGAPDDFDPVRLTNYRIDTIINAERQLDVTASVDFNAALSGPRMITFQLSHFLKVNSAALDGSPIIVYQNEGETEQRSNDVVTVLLPEPIERGKHYSVTFKYSGGVITDAGHGVLYVGARGNWYPQRGYRAANYDLTFHFPRKLSLVATGDLVEQKEEGETRLSHWKSKIPIRVAGFNIGEYEEAQAKTADGALVTVYANRQLEPGLDRRPLPSSGLPDAITPSTVRHGIPLLTPPQADVLAPRPTEVAGQMARELAQVIDYFSRNFGPLPFTHLDVSPIPGNFGQGWPGLIYLSTSAYIGTDEVKPGSDPAARFYKAMLPVHETAHQWWGHVVIPASYRDEWIMEALASYSAMMWLEQRDHNGPKDLHLVLSGYRTTLLSKRDDEVTESIGPLGLGYRLNNSRTPNGSVPIFYNKGPWVIHMLRQLMRDPKAPVGSAAADATFLKFLRTLRDEYSTRPLTTADFRALAERFVRPELNAESQNKGRSLEWFFDEWVSGTGIPELKVEAKIEAARAGGARAAGARAGGAGRAGAAKAAGGARPALGTVTIAGSAALAAVEETWIVPVPIFVQTPKGEVFAGVAVAGAGDNPDDAKFTLSAPGGSTKVLIDPQQTLLVIRK